ncbi:hypothetical protein [Tessaracoccus oleiagri]|uniref:Uncharacterized protein n=1 Tax=Tessaracoccus oleiagri TaxID=686624 RepID=A0A1G9LX45_9ACTN|nr:hypothetical protein [Tessaracoccus oleiagri]SDL66559.1 hypothetical protein SAMN04488242_2385 [Tessaracoccus oleiagri]
MSEEPLGPRRAHPSNDVAAFNESDPLAPRRAAGAPRRAARPRRTVTARPPNPWLVVALFAVLILAGIAGLYRYFGVHPPAGDVPTSLPTPTAADGPASPAPSPPGVREVVGDTAVTVPSHWRLYADELTEGDRRLIRVIDDATDVRLQVATLTTVGTDLTGACRALIDDQGDEYAVDFEVVPRYVSMEEGAVAVTCGFVGAREGQPETSVMFTMVQREADAHTLVLRVMGPRGLPADAPAVREVSAMGCEAAAAFGHPFPLC